jgi:hypothetical protein
MPQNHSPRPYKYFTSEATLMRRWQSKKMEMGAEHKNSAIYRSGSRFSTTFACTHDYRVQAKDVEIE